jgi:hypothetical protein
MLSTKQSQSFAAGDASRSPPIAPAFTAGEIETIAGWAAPLLRFGVRAEINLGHAFLGQALHVLPTGPDEPWWLVHKTPDGRVAVRQWPGLATIVPTVAEALAQVTRDAGRTWVGEG